MTAERPTYMERFHIADPVHGEVACIEVAPRRDGTLPVCLFLYGGGGSCETLLELRPLLSQAWQSGVLPACRVITPEVAPWGFYLDDAERGSAWESCVAETLVRSIRDGSAEGAVIPIALLGISMGGYGALKMALGRPRAFRAVAAIAPMVEPALCAADVRPRNRYHYPPQVPQALLGLERDAALYAADHPACRAVRNAGALRTGPLSIYLDAGARDALNAHDGAEFLHRVLWDLDIPHDYHLLADADHVGPSLLPRLEAAFRWIGEKLAPSPPALTALETEWQAWLDAGGTGQMPPPLPATSALMPRLLRTMLAPMRDAACQKDETLSRQLGLMPPAIRSRAG